VPALGWALTLQTKLADLLKRTCELPAIEAERVFPMGWRRFLFPVLSFRLPQGRVVGPQVAVPRDHVSPFGKGLAGGAV